MTALRPGREGAPYESYDAYGGGHAFEAAVDRLDDPLMDPLPGQRPGAARHQPQDPYGHREQYEQYEWPEPYGAHGQPAGQQPGTGQYAQTPGAYGQSEAYGHGSGAYVGPPETYAGSETYGQRPEAYAGPAQQGQGPPWPPPQGQTPYAQPYPQAPSYPQPQSYPEAQSYPQPQSYQQAPAQPYQQPQPQSYPQPTHPQPPPYQQPSHAQPAPPQAYAPQQPVTYGPGHAPQYARQDERQDARQQHEPGPAPADATAVMPPVVEPSQPRSEPPRPRSQRSRPSPWAEVSPEYPLDDRTVALSQVAERTDRGVSRETEELTESGGRAARRKAAQGAAKRGGKRDQREGSAAAPANGSAAEPAPQREGRRAERPSKDGPGALISRVVGELFITVGVLMLLFVTYQLWWTNVLAQQEAGGAASDLQQEWDAGGEAVGGEDAGGKAAKGKVAVGDDRKTGPFAPGQRFAIMHIPKLGVKVPIAEGISKPDILDKGLIGHYGKGEGTLQTAMPWDKQGNFAVAAHRNTHGEPFRYINKLRKGDKIYVETRNSYYTYEIRSTLPQTSPANTKVIRPVPPGSGFTKPGRYVTLTTCTPEFTSKYRMIVWGKLVEERPKNKGKPNGLGS